MYCPKCGTQTQDSAAFCMSCGESLRAKAHTTDAAAPVTLPPGYVLVPQSYLEDLERRAKERLTSKESPTRPARERGGRAQTSKREQIPDPSFTKFIDAPEPPLPFWIGKMAMAMASLGGVVWAILRAWHIGTIELLMKGVRENIPGIPFLLLAGLYLVSAISAFASKKNRTASGVSAVCLLFAAGSAFLERETYPTDPLILLAVATVVAALVFLISAAGGVTINLDD